MKSLTEETERYRCPFKQLKNIFNDEDLSKIGVNKTEINYQSGDIIIKQGSYVSQILFLKSGFVKIVIEGINKRNTILKLIGAGNFIALPVLGNPTVYPYSVVGVTDSKVCNIRKETIVEICQSNIAFNNYLLNWFSSDYTFLYHRISILSTRNNHGKLASALLYLTQKNFKDKNILEKISRKDLAELASISVESVNKILMELKYDKIIRIEDKTIRIIAPEVIEKLSTVG